MHAFCTRESSNEEDSVTSPGLRFTLAISIVMFSAYGQTVAPTNDAPNPYKTVEGWAKLPEGRKWGSTSAVDIDKDGKSIWVAERCGVNSCADPATGQMSPLDTVPKFGASG